MSALITLLFGLAALLSAAFGLMELRMLLRFLRNREAIRANGVSARNGASRRNGERLPTVTVQIPLFNERTSAEHVVRAAASQDYPRDRFDIQVLDDSTDETSEIVARVAAEVRSDGVTIEHLRRSSRAGYKAGALSEGLHRSDAEYVAVFDADFVPDPGFLTDVLATRRPFSDPEVAFVQARWSWDEEPRRGWLGSVLALLLDRHFSIQKPTRTFVGHVTTFNGSGGIWRRAAIDAAGGWTADTLTEDLDLSYRCALAGWSGSYLPDVRVPNELPADMRAFKLQQRRWAKGTAQCLRKLVGRIFDRESPLNDRWEEVCLLAGYAIHPLLLVCLLLWPWAVLHVDRAVFWGLQALAAVGVAAAGLSLLLTIHERDGRLSAGAVRELGAALAVGMGLMVNNTVGQIQGFVSSGGEFARTPKGRRRPRSIGNGRSPVGGRDEPRPYASALHWTLWLEIAVLMYCVGGAVLLVQRDEALWAIAMALWAAALALIVQQTVARTP